MNNIKQQLDLYINKFYLNRIIRGVLWFLAYSGAAFLFLLALESLFYLPSWAKISLLSIFIFFALLLLSKFVIFPLGQRLALWKRMNYKEAAILIGEHFSEVQDKLLNLLELEEKGKSTEEQHPFILASIKQRTEQLTVFSFPKAIDLKVNKKYIKWVLPSFLLLILIAIAFPHFLKETSYRWIHAQKNFDPPAPFTFKVQKEHLKAARFSDVLLQVELEGGEWHEDLFLVIDNKKYPMDGLKSDWFQFKWSQVEKSFEFYFQAGRYKSKKYFLEVYDRTQIDAIEIILDYPEYTGIKQQTLQGLTDKQVPEGSRITWKLMTENVKELSVKWEFKDDEQYSQNISKDNNGDFVWSNLMKQDLDYKILLKNAYEVQGDKNKYSIEVIKDAFPQIVLEKKESDRDSRQFVLNGTVSDDYGISKLWFVYQIKNEQGLIIRTERKSVPYNAKNILSYFEYYVDLKSLELKLGEQVSYFMEVWDNDGINGPKSTKSETYTFSMIKEEDLDAKLEEGREDINQGMRQSIQKSKEMEDVFEKAKVEFLQSDNQSWDNQQHLREMLENFQQIQKDLEQAQDRLEDQMEMRDLKKENSPLDEKRKELAEQIDALKNDELAEQLRKLQELMKEKDKSKALDAIEEIKEQNKMFQMDLERIQALMERLEMQQQLEQMGKELEKLAKEQKKEARNSDNNLEKQKEIQDKFEAIKSKLENDLLEKNNEMRQPLNLDKLSDKAEEIQEKLEEIDAEMKNSPQNKPSGKQNDAGTKMEEMAKMMQEQAAGLDMEQIDIDLKATRQLLSNLIRYSFDQEELMEAERKTPIGSEHFIKHIQKQKELKQNAEMMRDSLIALSQRVMSLDHTIQKETQDWIKKNSESLDRLSYRNVASARIAQRFAMGHANSMANKLEDLLKNLMQMQAMAMPADGEGGEDGMPMPGSGKSKKEQLQDIITGQEQLGQQMPGEDGDKGDDGQEGEEGADGEGDNGDSGEEGNKGEDGKNGMDGDEGGQEGDGGDQSGGNAEQMARWLHQQQLLRDKVKQLEDMIRGEGEANSPMVKLLQEIQEEMQKQERSILFNRKNKDQLQRNQEHIQQRLLEAEDVLREQEQSEERRAEQVQKIKDRPMPEELKEFLKQQRKKYELKEVQEIPLKKEYKEIAEKYLRDLNT